MSDDVEKKRLFQLRIDRTDSGSRHHYAAVWNAEEVRDDMVHNLLVDILKCVRGSVGWVVGRSTISVYGEYHFDSTEAEDLPF